MWKLLSTDSGYYQFINYITWPVILMLVVANSIWGNLERTIAVAMFFLAMFIGVAIGAEKGVRTKRVRLLAALPVSVRSLGLYRHFGTVVGWFIWMALLSLSSLISRRGHLDLNYLWWILVKIGSIYMFAGSISLPANLFYSVRDRIFEKRLIKWFVSPLLMIAIIIPAPFLYLFADDVVDTHGHRVFWAHLSEMVQAFPGALGVFLAGFIFLALDIYFFERRRSFIEDSIYPS